MRQCRDYDFINRPHCIGVDFYEKKHWNLHRFIGPRVGPPGLVHRSVRAARKTSTGIFFLGFFQEIRRKWRVIACIWIQFTHIKYTFVFILRGPPGCQTLKNLWNFTGRDCRNKTRVSDRDIFFSKKLIVKWIFSLILRGPYMFQVPPLCGTYTNRE